MSWSKPVIQFAVSHRPGRAFGAVAALALAGLAGCASAPTPDGFNKKPILPTENYSAKVVETPDQVALAVHVEGVSAAQQAALAAFVDRWRSGGGGAVVLKTPTDAASADQARAMTYAVQSQLEMMGVPPDRIQLAAYVSGDPKTPVLVSFERASVTTPDCRGGWDNMTSTMSNEPYKHFGCALTANIAAQIADPRDLVNPPALAPGDNTRRQVVLGKYREGKTTASEKDDQASGAVSTAVKQ
jgi:pilus assembly protein CpaD